MIEDTNKAIDLDNLDEIISELEQRPEFLCVGQIVGGYACAAQIGC